MEHKDQDLVTIALAILKEKEAVPKTMRPSRELIGWEQALREAGERYERKMAVDRGLNVQMRGSQVAPMTQTGEVVQSKPSLLRVESNLLHLYNDSESYEDMDDFEVTVNEL